jgi:hypothetical protein
MQFCGAEAAMAPAPGKNFDVAPVAPVTHASVNKR